MRWSQGFSKVEDPSQGLMWVRGEASALASDVRDLMQIHQGEHDRVEHGEHLSHRRKAHAAIILSLSVASRRQWRRFSTAQCWRINWERRWGPQRFCVRLVQP